MAEFAEQKTKREGPTQRKSFRNLHGFLLSLLLNIKLHAHRGKLCSHEKNDWRAVSRTIPSNDMGVGDVDTPTNQSEENPLKRW